MWRAVVGRALHIRQKGHALLETSARSFFGRVVDERRALVQDVARADRFPLETTHVSRWDETMGGARKGVARVADVATQLSFFPSCVVCDV